MFGVPSKFHNYRTQGRSVNLVDNVGLSINDSRTGINRNGRNGPEDGNDFSTVFNSATVNDRYRNYQHLWNPALVGNDTWTGSAAPGNIRASTWTNCIDNTYVTWPATIRPVPKTLMQDRNKLNDQGI